MSESYDIQLTVSKEAYDLIKESEFMNSVNAVDHLLDDITKKVEHQMEYGKPQKNTIRFDPNWPSKS